ncbi:MAG: 23S rRNA (guanosine2251-2'-O)-methyltransferase [Paracoccaceae bacterium]|jgi:23S rRNA (guanosine2251-2'-O)-methyltransferase
MAPRKTSQNRRPKGRKTAISHKGSADRTVHGSTASTPRFSENTPSSETRPSEKRRAPEKHPQNQNGLWLYGIHAVGAALTNPKRKCIRLLATTGAAAHLPDASVDAEIVDRDTIDAVLPYGAVHQGLALLTSNLASKTIEDIAHHAESRKRTVVVVLDQVTDPQNIGATLRSAAAFGAYAVIVPDRNTPDATGAMAKAASGALETVPLIRPGNLVRALETLKTHGFWVVGLDMDAPVGLPDADLPDRCVLALGAEGKGLRRLTRETCDRMVRVPMTSQIESLNVSASAAVSLYEWGRGTESSTD